jgi:hypothetical protein
LPKVVKDDRRLAILMLFLTTFLENVLLVFLIIEPGEPGCQTLYGRLKLGVQIDERA